MTGNVDTMQLGAFETQICEVDTEGNAVQRLCEIYCPECSDVEPRASDWGWTLAGEIERRYNAFPAMRELVARATDLLLMPGDTLESWAAWQSEAGRLLNSTEIPATWLPSKDAPKGT